MKIDHVEFLLEEAITAELAAMPLLAAKFRKIADEIKQLRSRVSEMDEDNEQTQCERCEGTGYAANCTEHDRERGDLWACICCNGQGLVTREPKLQTGE